MRVKILIGVLKVCSYALILWMGFALGLKAALKAEGVIGSQISDFSINEPMLFILIGILFSSLLMVLIIKMVLKNPLKELDIMNRKMLINTFGTTLAVGFLGAIIYRMVFLVVNTYLFNLN
jgi:uncharacterized membrane protein